MRILLSALRIGFRKGEKRVQHAPDTLGWIIESDANTRAEGRSDDDIFPVLRYFHVRDIDVEYQGCSVPLRFIQL